MIPNKLRYRFYIQILCLPGNNITFERLIFKNKTEWKLPAKIKYRA